MHPKARLLCFVASLLLVGSCAHMTVPADGGPMKKLGGVNCPGANQHHTGPIVCIDAISLAADPDPAPAFQGAWIHFYLSDPTQDLEIRFKEPGKFEFKERSGNEVWARVKDKAATGKTSYTAINLTTGKQRDPDIMIDPAP